MGEGNPSLLSRFPEWQDILPLELEKNSTTADKLGLELGRRWVALAARPFIGWLENEESFLSSHR